MYFPLRVCVYCRHLFYYYYYFIFCFQLFSLPTLKISQKVFTELILKGPPDVGPGHLIYFPHPLRVRHKAASETASEISRSVAHKTGLHPRA